MKKISLILTVALGVFLGLDVSAQTTNDYYVGKWTITVMGTPQGDAKMNFVFSRKEGKLVGSVQDSTGKELSVISKIEEKDKSITSEFNIQNYDVNLKLDPVDDQHVKGSLMGMFAAKGIRIKE